MQDNQWIEAVRWHGDTKIAAIFHTDAEWAHAKTLLATLKNVVVEAASQHEAVVQSKKGSRSTRHKLNTSTAMPFLKPNSMYC